MGLFDDLTQVLTPFANKIKQLIKESIYTNIDLQDYDVSGVVLVNGEKLGSTITSSGIAFNSGAISKVFKVVSEKTYTINFSNGNHRRYAFTTEVTDGHAVYGYVNSDSTMPATAEVTAPEGYGYLIVYYSTYAYDKQQSNYADAYIYTNSKLKNDVDDLIETVSEQTSSIEDCDEKIEIVDEKIRSVETDINKQFGVSTTKYGYVVTDMGEGGTAHRCTQTNSNAGTVISLTDGGNYWTCRKIDISSISFIQAYLRHPSSNTNRLWVFTDADDKIISTFTNSYLTTTSEWYTITDFPSNAKYIYLFTNRGISSSNASTIKYAIKEAQGNRFAETESDASGKLRLCRKVLPNYYFAVNTTTADSLDNDEWLSRKIASIPEGKSFIFITDTHWETNNQKSADLINYIRRKAGIKTVLFGGDAFNGEETNYAGIGMLRTSIQAFVDAFGEDFIVTPGNHDLNAYALIAMGDNPPPTTEQINSTLIPYTLENRVMTGHLDAVAVRDSGKTIAKYVGTTASAIDEMTAYMGLHYYIDDDINKIRYIILNSGNTFSGLVETTFGVTGVSEMLLQYDWYAEALRTVPVGYDVIVCIHELLYSASNVYPAMRARAVMGLLNARIQKTSGNMYLSPTSPLVENSNLVDYIDYTSNQRSWDFSDCGDIGIGLIMNGHWHVDEAMASGETAYSQYGTDIHIDSGSSYTGVLAITTQCDRTVTSPSAKQTATVAESVTEQCFDIVTIANDGIYCTRIGTGNDRVYKYTTS